MLFISTANEDLRCSVLYKVEESDCDYRIRLEKSQFKNEIIEFLSSEVTNEECSNGIEDDFGVVYSSDGTQLLRCRNKEITSYRVKDGCIVIRSSAFRCCFNLSRINLPDSLTYIGNYAFSSCHLSQITLPKGLTHIGDAAFYDSRLSSITLPGNLIHIGSGVFVSSSIHDIVCDTPNFVFRDSCLIEVKTKKLLAFFSDEEIVELPTGISKIGEKVFQYKRNLSKVILPTGLTHIGAYAFSSCHNLSSVTFPNGLIFIGDRAFSQCSSLLCISLPSSLTHIGKESFVLCEKLTSIDLPMGLTCIGNGAFSNCHDLSTIILPDSLTRIPDIAFSSCFNLSSITLPKYLTHIGNRAFYSCYNLSNITLPISLTHIGKEAFSWCKNLTNLTLPNNLTHIGDAAFSDCHRLSQIILPANLTYIGSRVFESTLIRNLVSNSPHFMFQNGCLIEVNEKKIIAFLLDEKVIMLPKDLTHIGDYVFSSYYSLRSISFPDGLKHIGDWAFTSCLVSNFDFPSGLEHIGKMAFSRCVFLNHISLPDGLVYIGDDAFSECPNLSSVTLPATLMHIGTGVFKKCLRLSNIYIPAGTRKHFKELLPKDLYSKLKVKTENTKTGDKQKHLYYLFFDTETTGVPKDYNAPASNTMNWPRLVQLGWILTDESGNEISSGNEIIKPEGFVIPTDVSRVHGITTEVALREGKPLKQVLQSFMKDAEGIKCFVGHNVSFDQKVVGAELYRLGIADTVSTARSLDTMVAATDYCKIPGVYGYKWPKLIELHRKLFGCDFEDAHDAMADITATKKCFFEMKRRGLI